MIKIEIPENPYQIVIAVSQIELFVEMLTNLSAKNLYVSGYQHFETIIIT